jgi:hypothetical protein
MHHQATASGHVFCVERKRGPQWYCKYRVASKQVQKRLGHDHPGPTQSTRPRRFRETVGTARGRRPS